MSVHPRAEIRRRLWVGLLAIICIPPFFFFITTPMNASHQALMGIASVMFLLVANRMAPSSRRVSLWLTLLSVLVSTRYLYWRATETLIFASGLEAVLGYGLFLAELYAWLILVLGYLQTLWPLARPVTPLPDDMTLWPTVDVYIPTYNESLAVVTDTVLAAQNLDYPHDKLRIYILDDGRRKEFAAFANQAGVGYIKRPDNQHAKAGNLNHAMRHTHGELICVFDCDHVPTRGFLQSTVGGFLYDQHLAMLQTPHYFYSPDPFERNLRVSDQIPREGDLFYGPVQQGNDFWNATFFCGSCAVIRREALDEIGGFAVETVTEDAHTALKFQRRGWGTAFLAMPLAAGLATERLSLHIGQRARWARGMTQILRRDNPLFGRGLTLMQRVCYLNAMLHFQFALPRIVFLTAPLAYLLLGQNIIASSAAMIFAYALPHLVHAILTNSRLVGRYRYSFWGEIYEAALAFQLVKPTLVTLLDPKRGKFNVTDKGGLLPQSFFDADAVKPQLITAFFLAAGLLWGAVRFIWDVYYDIERDVMLLNLFWASFSLLGLLAAISVGRETRQVRESVRVQTTLPVALYLTDGHVLRGQTMDISMTGARIRNPLKEVLPAPLEALELYSGDELLVLRCKTLSTDRKFARVEFEPMPIDQRRRLVRVVMGRADAWLRDHEQPRDNPLRSLFLVWVTAFSLFLPQRSGRRDPVEVVAEDGPSRLFRWVGMLAFAGLLTIMSWLALKPAFAEELQAPAMVPDMALDFARLGHPRGLTLRGDGAQAGVGFAVPGDHVVTDAELVLDVLAGDALLPRHSSLLVEINGQVLRSIPLDMPPGERLRLRIPVNPSLVVSGNRINFRLRGRVDERCHRPYDPAINATVLGTSGVSLSVRALPLTNELARLPEPFLYSSSSAEMVVPVLLPEDADASTLHAAALLASWFGAEAGHRGARFMVYLGMPERIPAGHALVLSSDAQAVDQIPALHGDGPRIGMANIPGNAPYKMLQLHAEDGEGLLQAARFLALKMNTLSGPLYEVDAPVALPSYGWRDIPAWQSSGDVLRLGDLADPGSLRVSGLYPPLINVNFRTDPGLFLPPGDTVPMTIGYRFPEVDWLDERNSRLDVSLNGEPLKSLPVNRPGLLEQVWAYFGGRVRQERATLRVPPHLLHGQNQLGFYFNMRPTPEGDCERTLPGGSVSYIDPDSALDLRRGNYFARVPELGHFVAAGHPLTDHADLSTSLLVLPEKPDAHEVSALLDMMGRMGQITGVPATGIALTLGADAVQHYPGRHVLAISTLSDPLAQKLIENTPYALRQRGHDVPTLRIRPRDASDRWRSMLSGDWQQQRTEADRMLTSQEQISGLFSWQSPGDSSRAVMMLAAQESEALPGFVQRFSDPAQAASASGDMLLAVSADQLVSFRVGPYSMQGDMRGLKRLQWGLSERPLLLLLALGLFTLILSISLAPLLRARAERRISHDRNVLEENRE